MPIDWAAIRAEFPALRNWTFLNSATFGQMPTRTVEAMQRHFDHRDELACWDFLEWFDDADKVRQSVAQLIGCTGEDIAFIPHAATGFSLLLGGIEWKPGDRVVTSGIFKLRNGMNVVENNNLSPNSEKKPNPSDS